MMIIFIIFAFIALQNNCKAIKNTRVKIIKGYPKI